MSRFIFCAAGLAALLAAAPAFAAVWTWDGSEGNANWTNTPNWSPASVVVSNGTADLIFGIPPQTQISPNMNANWSINSVTFNNTAVVYQLVSLTGSTLTVGAGGITNNDADQQRIGHAIALSAAQTWNAGSGGLLFNGPAVNNGGHLLTIDGTGVGAVVNGVTISGALSGSGGLTKNGVGEATIFGITSPVANTYTGTTTVNAGTLILSRSDGITSIPGALQIGDGIGTNIDLVQNVFSNQIADSATVSLLSTGAWTLSDITSEAITNLNVVSIGIAGGGLVTMGSGTVTVLGNLTMTGGTVTTSSTGTLQLSGNLTTNAAVIAAGISSKLNLAAGARTFTIADGAALNDLDVTGVVSNGGIIKNGLGALRLGAANTYAGGTTLNAGTILIGHNAALGTGQLTGAGGALQADGAARTIANTVTGSFAVDGLFDLALSSPLHGDITKSGPGTLVFVQAGAVINSLTIDAGSARLDAAVTFTGGVTNSGTLLLGTQTLTLNGSGLNNQGSLPLAGNVVAGPAMFSNNAGGTVSGHGTISAPFANSGGTLRVVGGTMNVTGAFTNSGVIRLDGGEALVGGAITNTGLIQGDGTIANALTNAAGGELRADPGKSLTFTDGGGHANAGQIRLLGGALDFQNVLTNQAGAFISGNGSLLTGGLTNHGTMNFAGTANLVGDVTNSATGKVISGGGGATIFYDDVTNNGEIRTSTNGFTVFFGDVTGGGTFTGTGTVNFEGDLNPGNSPAAVSFAGSVGFGPAASLGIELGGITPGTQYDQLVVAGSVSLAGTLVVSLIDAGAGLFAPAAGDSFDILDWGSLSGAFAAIQLPSLAGALAWNTSQLYTDGVLSVVAPGVDGDYNDDGKVDAADYVVWRKFNTTSTPLPNDPNPVPIDDDQYNTWRANFGETDSGSGGSPVPEPVAGTLLMMAAALSYAANCRRGRGTA